MSRTQYFTLKDYEDRAAEILPEGTLSYIKNGADNEITLRSNDVAWKRYKLRPRMLRGVEERNLKTSLLGQQVSMPIGVAPTGLHKLVAQEGEMATSRAAGQSGCVFSMSTVANETMENVAKGFPEDGVLWYQLYVLKEKERTIELIHRVEDNGFKALVITIDVPVVGNRKDNGRYPLQLNENVSIPAIPACSNSSVDVKEYLQNISSHYDSNLTWDDIRWLSNQTRLPVIAKGIMSGQDAILAVNSGCKAVWVSNHGARQLDNEPATADVLKEVVHSLSSCSSSCEIYVDGGIRNGTDVLTALALGAHAVFIGRPILYGLACRGQQGVEHVLQLLRKEFDTAMALCGVKTVQECRDDSLVIHEKQLPSRL